MDKYFLLKTIPDSNNKVASNESIFNYDQMDLLQGRVGFDSKTAFKVKKGFDKYDFLETEWPGIKLCSQKVVEFLQRNNIRGCSFTGVTLICNNIFTDKHYFMLHILGKCGPFDYSKSEVISKTGNSFIELKGRYFDVDSINDYDIFIVDKTVMIFITEKLKELMVKEGFTNVELISNTEFTGSVSMNLYNVK